MAAFAFLFPGQGSQAVGMGVSLADAHPQARRLFDEASQAVGWDLLEACRQGPDDRLRQTHIAQPALYVTGYAAAVVLDSQGLQPGAVAGHSIGEYAALAFAGTFGFREGLNLVRERGRLMQAAADAHPGAMAAILGLSPEQVAECCQQAQADGVCLPVNFNSPEQIVIAGEKQAVEKASKLAGEAGAKRVIALNVSGAFHSPLMKDAAQAMRQVLAAVQFTEPGIPIVMNVDGRLYNSASQIQEALARQLESPVQWVKTLETLKNNGFNCFIECGAGRVLSGLVKKFDRQLQTYSTESAEGLAQTAEALKGQGVSQGS